MMKNILIFLGEYDKMRLYDILSIIFLSIWTNNISTEISTSSFNNIDICFLAIYLFSLSWIVCFYLIYQEYFSIHDAVCKSQGEGYDEKLKKAICDDKDKLLIKLRIFFYSLIAWLLCLWLKSL
jgi:hypothetical protein